MSNAPFPWGDAVESELARLQRLIQAPGSFYRLWNIVFSEDDRIALGNDFNALGGSRSVGSLIRLYGWSQRRAIIEGASMLNLIDDLTHRYLLRAIGEATTEYDIDETRAATAFQLLVVPARRVVYWRAQQLEIAWSDCLVLWNYFSTLARNSSRGATTCDDDFDDRDRSLSCLSNWKYRLCRLTGFPDELGRAIVVRNWHHRIDLPAGQICILDEDSGGRQVRRVQGR